MARTVATAPKRWPKNAEGHRLESIAIANQCDRALQAAREAVRRGDRAEALYQLGEGQLAVREIADKLRKAKEGIA